MSCLNCGKNEAHFVPPLLGEPGFCICQTACAPVTPQPLRKVSKWDLRFMAMADLVASWSKDPSTKTGAVIVSPDRTDVIFGYNGFPSRMKDDPSLYANREFKYSRIVHCEMNAVLNAKRSVRGYTLYTAPFLSCDRCAVHMIAAGIVRVVAPKPTPDQATRWEEAFKKTRGYFREANIEVIEYDRTTGEYEPLT